MERIFPKIRIPKPLSLLEAIKLIEAGKTPFVLYPKDGALEDYGRRDLKEFLGECFEDCAICVDEWE